MQLEDEVVEYITTGKAAPLLGVKDTRTVIRIIEAGWVRGIQLPSGHWRVNLADVLSTRQRMIESGDRTDRSQQAS